MTQKGGRANFGERGGVSRVIGGAIVCPCGLRVRVLRVRVLRVRGRGARVPVLTPFF